MKLTGIFLLILFLPGMSGAQEYTYERDTSYTIRSAYLKLKKDYPGITPVAPSSKEGVLEDRNRVYSETTRPLTADVFYPPMEGRNELPGVLLIYGGGWSSGEKANQVPMAQYLAANGYVAVVVEYRLSPEARYPAAVDDLKHAIRWMRRNAVTYKLDTSKLAVLGCSAGAQLATLAGVTGKGSVAVQGIVNIDGIVSFIHPEAEEGKYAARWLGGTKDEVPEIWKEASPLEYAGPATPPIIFINSAYPRFHAGRDDMIRILDKYGIYSEVHTLENSPHSFWLVYPWFEETARLTTDFLDKIFGSPATPGRK